MTKAFIGIGSNLGDRAGYLALAQARLSGLSRTRLVGLSAVYETEAVGPVPQGRYLNGVAQLETDLDPYELWDSLEAIELESGREPRGERVKWGPRTLDLDLLLYGDRVVSSDELVVPHPLMHERWFVLKPLADLDAGVVHPVLEMTAGELLADLERRRVARPAVGKAEGR